MSAAERRASMACFTPMLLSVVAIPSVFRLILEGMAGEEDLAGEDLGLFEFRV